MCKYITYSPKLSEARLAFKYLSNQSTDTKGLIWSFHHLPSSTLMTTIPQANLHSPSHLPSALLLLLPQSEMSPTPSPTHCTSPSDFICASRSRMLPPLEFLLKFSQLEMHLSPFHLLRSVTLLFGSDMDCLCKEISIYYATV